MGVNSLHKTVTRQRRDCDLNSGPSALESSTLATRLRGVSCFSAQNCSWLILHRALRQFGIVEYIAVRTFPPETWIEIENNFTKPICVCFVCLCTGWAKKPDSY